MADVKAAIIASAKKLIEELKEKKIELYNKDWLRTWDMTRDQLDATLLTTEILELFTKANIDVSMFKGAMAVCEFRDNSTRTRFSFFKAATMLGLIPTELDVSKSQIAHGETVRETACMISFLSQVMGIRDDKYLYCGHAYQTEFASALEDAYSNGVLNQRPSVINLQCDEDHPTQSMSDLMHILSLYDNKLENLKGKKIAMCWAYAESYGKPLSVAQSLITLLPRFGMKVHLAYPEGYDLLPEVVDVAKKLAVENGGELVIGHDMKEACTDAEVIYCKSWAPYTVLEKKGELLKSGKPMNHPEMQELEKKALANNALHKDWTVTEDLMKVTKGREGAKEADVMHCLPADISGVSCVSGEIDGDVFERHRINMWKEASHKPFVQAAMIALTRIEDLPAKLEQIIERDQPKKM